MKEEEPTKKESDEIEFLDRLLSAHFGDRAFFLLYERENGHSASIQRNLSFGDMINACVNMKAFLEEQCRNPIQPNN